MTERTFTDFSIEKGKLIPPSEILMRMVSINYDDDDPEIDPYVHIHEQFLMKFAAYIEHYYGRDSYGE